MIGTAYYPIVASTGNLILLHSALLGAGAAAPTKPAFGGVTNGRAGRGIVSVSRIAAGRFTLTLQDVPSIVVGLMGTVHTGASVAPLLVKYVEGSFAQGNGITTKPTLIIETWDLAAPALADPPLNALINVDILFQESPNPN